MSTDYLAHEGVGHLDDPPGRGSGRYGSGTGKNPGQHQYTFMSEVKRYRAKGMKDEDIAKVLLGPDATSTSLRNEIAIQRTNARRADTARARELLIQCNGNVSEVGRRMGKSESSIRKLLDPDLISNNDKYLNTANYLKQKIAEKGVLNISPGTEISMNVTANTLKNAVYMLEKEGYIAGHVLVPQQTTKNKTNVAVLCPPGTEFNEKLDRNGKTKTKWINWKKNEVHSIEDYSPDEGHTWETIKYPASLDSSRISIRYAEDGGLGKDGVIEIRKNVKDLSLGNAQYAQVRIAVDGTHYLKGMAMYADDADMPKGVDVVFNTNKKRGTPMIDGDHGVLKPLKVNSETGEIDKDNPFGALIKRGGQYEYVGDDGKKHLSPINKLREEGEWDSWSKNISSQFLSKQPLKLINQQINMSLAEKKDELSEIKALTNPVLKKKMLMAYAEKCDSNASDLSVRGFRNQAFQVLLPVTDMKENEIYAPAYKDGDTVALVRYPHGGTFEIPILKVNNKNAAAKKVMQNATDAVGITPKTAAILSGADFDGDTAVVIPIRSNRLVIKSDANSEMPALKSLKEFNPKSYALPDDAPRITNRMKQRQMGEVTNLITDMTAAGASFDKIARAVKHSMVVIDSEKHHLDYNQSAKDQKIQDLKAEFQDGGGASTIFSRANANVWIPKHKEINNPKIMDPSELKDYKEGKKVYRDTGDIRNKRKQIKDPNKMNAEQLKLYQSGKKVYEYSNKTEIVQQQVTGMASVKDAMDLVYNKDNPKEVAYAKYANTLRGLANSARKEARNIKTIPVSQSAKRVYAKEVEDLNKKLRIAESNKPRENQAQLIAAARSSERIKSNPDLDYEHISRIKTQELQKARDEVGAHKKKINITDREWEAIQANAISTHKLEKILDNTDQDALVKLATPRNNNLGLTETKLQRIQTMYNSGMYTQKDIAEALGLSSSTVSKAVKGEI